MYFWPNGLAALRVAEEHHVANATVEDYGELFQSDLGQHLLATAGDQKDWILQLATRGTRFPRTCTS